VSEMPGENAELGAVYSKSFRDLRQYLGYPLLSECRAIPLVFRALDEVFFNT
jgi:hypothetical protein